MEFPLIFFIFHLFSLMPLNGMRGCVVWVNNGGETKKWLHIMIKERGNHTQTHGLAIRTFVAHVQVLPFSVWMWMAMLIELFQYIYLFV